MRAPADRSGCSTPFQRPESLEGTAGKAGLTDTPATPACGRPFPSIPNWVMPSLPVETPTDDYYGGHRLGSNLFGKFVVCVDLDNGKRILHYQITHHDIWNYDLPSAPALVNMTIDGKPVRALVQLTKQAYAYVLDRVTGQPVWPFEERSAPASDVPGERAWSTQPHPTKPPPYDYQGYVEDDLIDFTPELRAEAIRIAKQYRLGPVVTPPPEITLSGAKGSWE